MAESPSPSAPGLADGAPLALGLKPTVARRSGYDRLGGEGGGGETQRVEQGEVTLSLS